MKPAIENVPVLCAPLSNSLVTVSGIDLTLHHRAGLWGNLGLSF